ncbi:subclass B1 metallo-beta-lactamase [Corallococcus exercitus]|nr:subclass B1 metallo-beta-lactamase [Corallococcus exercitus]
MRSPDWSPMKPLRRVTLLAFLACAATSSAAPPKTPKPAKAASAKQEETVLSKDVSVRRIAPGVWLHITKAGKDWGGTPANGLLVEDGDASILVDTGWTPEHSKVLLAWAKDTLHHPVRAALVTHFHIDRTGGIPTLDAQGIPVHAREDTARRAKAQGNPVPQQLLTDAQDFGPLSVFFPGAGHTPDNLVVMHPASGILYGGCFIKDATAKTLGNMDDADVTAWPGSLKREREHFPNARIIVPGHEQPGGTELLDHTEALLKKASH